MWYAPLVVYNNAAIKWPHRDVPLWMERDGDNRRDIPGSKHLSGTYKIGDDRYLDIGVHYRDMPDFCGGSIVFSPYSRIARVAGWGAPFAGVRHCGVEKALEEDKILDLTGLDIEGKESWVEYGYECLAAHVMREMTAYERMGAVMSGPTDDTKVTAFCEAWKRVEHLPPYFYSMGAVELDAVETSFRQSPDLTVSGYYQQGPAYLNVNSGREVCYWNLVIGGSSAYWIVDEEDYELEEMGAHELYGLEHRPIDGADRAPTVEQLREAALTAATFINRENWRNG